MKCPICGADNPDYVFYCGKCATQLKGILTLETGTDSSRRGRPQTMIESILRRNLLRIEENAVKKRKGLFGRFRGTFPQGTSETLVFKSEYEETTLSIDNGGHASVSRGPPPHPTVELVGPHDSFLAMFQDERNIRNIPSSIIIRLRNRELSDETVQRMLREGVEKLLRILFK